MNFLGSCIIAILTFASAAHAQTVVTAKDPRPALQREVAILNAIMKYADKPEVPRLKTILTVVNDALTTINSHENIANYESVQSIQNVVLTFRYSTSFFEQIRSDLLSKRIDEAQNINETLAKDFGFDAAEGATIVALILKQEHSIVSELLDSDMPSDLRSDVSALLPVLGRALAISSTGDRPNAYAAADDVYNKISALYDRFAKISISQSAFSVVQELVQLNEFYASYGQVGSRRDKPKGATK